MANPYDAFDPPPGSAPAQPAAPPAVKTANPYDAFDPPATAAPVTAAPAAPVAGAPPIAHPVAATPAPPAVLPWVTNWSHGGDVNLPQSWQDFGNVAGEQASAGASLPMARMEAQQKGQSLDLPTQLAQLAAAKARLGPGASGVADILGYYASPTTLLNAIPGAGGGLAGASHEGLKSYFEGGDVAADTLKGGLSGLAATGVAHTLASSSVLSKLLDATGTGGAAAIAHSMFGGSPTAAILGGNMANRWVQPAVKWTEEHGGPLLSKLRPYLAAAIQGPALAPENPLNQWIAGQ
jgi:hypothetical protein